jgi:hypothetical protein|uniref:Uncharacterized protein n=1 Tax=viral metagenome TaxID=1070528 RepID=A0A6C0ATI9_9ZZZZ
MSNWTAYVTKFYKAEHAKNPNYKFKNALKDAAKSYKSQGTVEAPKKGKTGKNKRRTARKTRKHRK